MPHRLLWPYALAVLGGGLLTLILQLDAGRLADFGPAAVPCALLALYGEKRALYIAGFGALNFGEPVYFAVALQYGPTAAGLLAAVLGVAGDALQQKAAPVAIFNVGWAFLTFGAVGGLADRVGHAPVAFALCVVAYLVVAGVLQAVAMRYILDLPLARTAREQVRVMQYSGLAVLSIGGLALLLLGRQPWALLLLGFPVEILSAHVERERLHQQLVAAQGALIESEKRAAVSLLGAGVAHELNSPLAAILVNCHMLASGTLRKDEQATCVRIVEKAATRAKDIVQALLTYARPPAGASACAPARALEDCLLLLSPALAPARITTLPEDVPTVQLGAGPLMQVFTNLLQNGRHAVETRGADGRLDVTAEWDDAQVRLRVRDNGSGMPPEIVGRIFDPFFTTREPGRGTGLGLAVVRSLLEPAGGRIDVEQTGPDGTTMLVALPRADVSPR